MIMIIDQQRKMAMNSMNNATLNLLSIKKIIIEFVAILLVINMNYIGLVVGHSEPQQQHHNNHICEHKHPKANDVSFFSIGIKYMTISKLFSFAWVQKCNFRFFFSMRSRQREKNKHNLANHGWILGNIPLRFPRSERK